MALDHEAIYKAYAGTVVSIDDGAGAFDKDGNSSGSSYSSKNYQESSQASNSTSNNSSSNSGYSY